MELITRCRREDYKENESECYIDQQEIFSVEMVLFLKNVQKKCVAQWYISVQYFAALFLLLQFYFVSKGITVTKTQFEERNPRRALLNIYHSTWKEKYFLLQLTKLKFTFCFKNYDICQFFCYYTCKFKIKDTLLW